MLFFSHTSIQNKRKIAQKLFFYEIDRYRFLHFSETNTGMQQKYHFEHPFDRKLLILWKLEVCIYVFYFLERLAYLICYQFQS